MENQYFEDVDSYDDAGRKDERSLDAGSLDRPVRHLTLRKPLCLDDSRPASEAIELMREQRTGSVLVTREGRLVGIFTERDVLNKLALEPVNPCDVPLSEVMRGEPEVLSLEAPMAYALNLMSVGGFRHVPLVDEDHHPVGVVSVRDIVNHLVDYFPDKVLNFPPSVGIVPASREGA